MKFYIIFLVITVLMVTNLQLYKAEELDPNNDYTFKDTDNGQVFVVPRKIDNYNGNKPAIAKSYNNKTATHKESANKAIANNTLINNSNDTNLNTTDGNVDVQMSEKEFNLWEKFKKLFG